MGELAIEIKRGETFTKVMRLKDDNGTPLDLSGATITAQIRKESNGTLIADFDTSILEDDWYKLQLEPDVTAELEIQQGLFWDSRVELATGTVIYTEKDTVKIKGSITETP